MPHDIPQNDPSAHLQITSGLHTGVDIPLEHRPYTIGSSSGADIVLSDENIRPEHVVLHVENKHVRVEAIGGDVTYQKGVITIGHGARLRFPVELTIGSVGILLTGDAQDPQSKNLTQVWQHGQGFASRRPWLSLALIFFLLTAMISGVVSLAQSSLGQSNKVLEASQSQQQGSDKEAASILVEQAVVAFKRHLTDQNIDTIHVAGGRDNRIAVSGRVGQSSVPAWNAVLKWFDETYTGQITLTSTVDVVGDDEARGLGRIRLQAVWFGERPYIILEDGTRYFEGSLVDNGWILKEVQERKIILNKADQTIAINYSSR